jgi:hypothetical protein
MCTDAIPSYGSIYALGHRAIAEIFNEEVLVEEKIDGSLFAFGVLDGELRFRSKGQQLFVDSNGVCSQKMFQKAVDTAMRLKPFLRPGWVYYGEFLQKPKHNTLAYTRIPKDNIILFDISDRNENFLPYDEKRHEALSLGLECAPLICEGTVSDFNSLKLFLSIESVLGGTKIEGVVVKNYARFGLDKKCYKGKLVSEAFKESNNETHKVASKGSVIGALIASLKTDARWRKAIQHLREEGKLEGSPRDIGNLIREIKDDILKEEQDHIIHVLYNHFLPEILNGVIRGFPEWYKDYLAKQAFEDANDNTNI